MIKSVILYLRGDLKKFIWLFGCLALLGGYANAETQVYFWKDERGRSHYTDQLKSGAAEVRIKGSGTAYYPVAKVYDGDTVLLENGTRVRLLGVNTPEVESRNKSAEKGGPEAKSWLVKYLTGKSIRLETDLEKKDRYGRTLAHLFTQENDHVNLEILKKGYGFVDIHPPNVKYAKQFEAAQFHAEKHGLGIWGYREYKPKAVASINRENSRGWNRWAGRVREIRKGRRFAYLLFDNQVNVRIELKNLMYFPQLNYYEGKRLEIRGWPNRRQDRFSILIRHPSAIKMN